jgi:hypothetical protein
MYFCVCLDGNLWNLSVSDAELEPLRLRLLELRELEQITTLLVSDPLCLSSSSSSALHFSDYSFRVHHLVNRHDRQLLAHAMASDFSVALQCLSKRTIGFLLWNKLRHYYI